MLFFGNSAYPSRPLEAFASSATTSDQPPPDSVVFDYVVVGGGSAGCVTAHRLSERGNCSVLLVERGAAVNSWVSRVPLLSVDYRAVNSPSFKWKSAPVESLKSTLGTLNMVSGKALGGTSKINGHLYTRPIPAEFTAWTQEGRQGWSWEDVLPFFVKSETSLSNEKEAFRGHSGPWQNQMLSDIFFNSVTTCIEACENLGIPYVEKANDPDAPAPNVGRVDMTIDRAGYRNSTFDAFLPAAFVEERKNQLTVCTDAIVHSVHIQKDSSGRQTVVGVWLEHEDYTKKQRFYVRVGREVVSCAGAIGSPQLLQLSGIGPANHLSTVGIPLQVDLAGVGLGLQDHIGVPLIFRCAVEDSLHIVQNNLFVALKELLKYLLTGKGLFLCPNPQATIFAVSRLLDDNLRTVVNDPSDVDPYDPKNIPDIEIMPIPYAAADSTLPGLGSEGAFSLLVVILRPKSKGEVRTQSTDPHDRPSCNLNALNDPEDLVLMRKGLRLGLRIAEKMRENGYPLRDLQVPLSQSEKDLDSFILSFARTTYHYSSSCRMAPLTDSGVVDDQLRVHGVSGLRVADASVFPSIPATHLAAPSVMMAERCAEMMLSEYKA